MKLLAERRKSERQPATANSDQLTLALRAGVRVAIIDLSSNGALVETSVRLEPGAKLAIRTTPAREGMGASARVVHCRVWSLDRRSGIRFRAGLEFDPCSDYTPTKGPRVAGNEIPSTRRRQLRLWGPKAPFVSERPIGTQFG